MRLRIATAMLLVAVFCGQSFALCPPGSSCLMCAIIRAYGWDAYYNWRAGTWQIPTESTRANKLVGSSVGPFSVYDPTPEDAVQFILDQLDLGPDDVLYEPGCGDARILIAAVERFGCRGVGIEIDPKVAKLARSRIRRAGCQRLRIVIGDARNYSYDQADAVVMYLFPNLMAELLPKIDCPVVSYLHPIEGRSAKRIKGPGQQVVYVSRTRSVNLRVQ